MYPHPTVVLVEDSSTQAMQIAAHLTEQDVEVAVASDGPQGLRLISTMMPKMVVLDIYLPTMDGFQVCRRLKRDPATAHIPVVMLTSSMTEEDKQRGYECGAMEYIRKDKNAVDSLMDVLRRLAIIT